MCSILGVEKKLPVAALSQQSPLLSHAASHAVLARQPMELLAGVLAAPVGVMQQRAAGAASPDRHPQPVIRILDGFAGTAYRIDLLTSSILSGVLLTPQAYRYPDWWARFKVWVVAGWASQPNQA